MFAGMFYSQSTTAHDTTALPLCNTNLSVCGSSFAHVNSLRTQNVRDLLMRQTRSPAILDNWFLSQLLLPNRQEDVVTGRTWLRWPWNNSVILSTVRNGRWRHYRCVPAADGRSDLTRQSSPCFPSQHDRYNATGCFFFATIVPVKPSAGVAISLLHITAVQYYSYSLFLYRNRLGFFWIQVTIVPVVLW